MRVNQRVATRPARHYEIGWSEGADGMFQDITSGVCACARVCVCVHVRV
jgi:hypothetical protein